LIDGVKLIISLQNFLDLFVRSSADAKLCGSYFCLIALVQIIIAASMMNGLLIAAAFPIPMKM